MKEQAGTGTENCRSGYRDSRWDMLGQVLAVHGDKSASQDADSPNTDRLLNLLGPLAGARIAGGCHHCDAEQTITYVEPLVWSVTVGHEDDCPILARST